MVKANTNIGQDELQALQQRVAELELVNKNLRQANLKVVGDIDQIRERAERNASTTGNITYKEIRGYIPMKMYHSNGIHIGKAVGPLHPANAVETAVRFKKIGIILTVNPPSDRYVEEYKKSEEYIKLKAAYDKERLAMDKSKKSSELEKLTKEISKLTGLDKSQLVQIKNKEDVK